MIKRSIRCVMALAVVSVALAQATSMFLMRAKAESSIWSGSLTVAEGQGVTTERVQNRLDCTMRDVYIKKFGAPIDTVVSVISLGNFVYENIGRRCVIENAQGYFTSETYSTTDKLSYELHTKNSQTYWLDPAPAGTVVFVGAKTNYNDSFYSLGIESQFAKTGELVNGITNIKWRYNDASIPLKDMLGNKIRFYDHAFSANGQYAVVRFDRSVAVIDLQELTLTPVGYIRNWSKYADMAVSDDGRYVALQNNGVFIYDTSGCQRRYA
ncbi:hypothetical protein KC959_04355, partial [Candidatus Saccharibacteria bacterium]|nr:hypothetical protein [Candidatus Saccharibacteria bacterium]